ncbi:hypothetical protein [Candidatus Uabimicrobium sp. HlEnr_7]|uniref:lipase/acyltransferase domain-containing protein n=1 Tax=Candidatus Uabimicrobium helgolandensis TaxID=3095367 RepID=UPI0035564943
MTKIIIGIHGLANKPEESQLQHWWKEAIAEGLKKNYSSEIDFEFKMIYWADLFYRHPLHDDKDYEFDSLYNSEPYIEAKDGALQPYETGWFQRIRTEMTDPSGRILDLIKDNFNIESAADYLLSKFFKDLHFYYSGKKLKDREGNKIPAKEILHKQISKVLGENQDKEIMFVSHSMGSLIAFDSLHGLPQNIKISEFVTIGSPLGISHVKLKASDSGIPLKKPSCITGKWINYADKKDPIAIDSHLSDDYEGGVEDDMVLNDYESNGKRNYHKSYGYLRTPEFSKHAKRFLENE